MTGITWLHLSDWHQGRPDFDRRVVLTGLIDDIRNRIRISPELEKIDFIVFSGDVAHSGKREQYEAAKQELFEPVLQVTGLKPRRLFIVPGNHDLDLDALELLPQAISQPFISNDQVNQWLSNEQKCNRLREPFAAYRELVALYTGQAQPDYANIRRFTIEGKRVALLGINSALMCGRNKDENGEINDEKFLTVGERQIFDAIEKMKHYDVRIAVLHHPFSWLAEFERRRIKDLLEKNCHFILYGHQHFSDFWEQGRGNDQTCVIIPAGATYDCRSTGDLQYANAYNFVHLDLEGKKGIVYLRRWFDGPSRWDKDLDTTSASDGKINFDIPQKEGQYSSQSPPVISLAELPAELNNHFKKVVKKITQGSVVFFLGADINLCDRPEDEQQVSKDKQQVPRPWDWEPDGEYPPTNSELATYLNGLKYLKDVSCPLCSQGICPPECPINAALVSRMDLSHVSQYLSITGGLITAIKEISKHHYKPNRLHQLLADLPRRMDEKEWSSDIQGDAGSGTRYPLIVTANLDSTLERAFIEAEQPFDLVSYSSINKSFIHQSDLKIVKEQGKDVIKTDKDNGIEIPPTKAKEYSGLDLNQRPVILKLYCPTDWIDDSDEPFAITEDHFIDYLVCSNIEQLIPGHLITKLRNSYIWFLGYSLSHWNLRVILNRLWEQKERGGEKWYVIQPNPGSLDEELWKINNTHPVDLFGLSLGDYVNEMEKRLQAEPSRRERRHASR